MMVLIGVILYVAIDRVGAGEAALFGLIPAAIGLANLVYAAIQWKKEQADERKEAVTHGVRAASDQSRSEISAARTLSGAAASS